MSTAEFRREVERELTGRDSETSELIYFKIHKSHNSNLRTSASAAVRAMSAACRTSGCQPGRCATRAPAAHRWWPADRKSTRLNSSHLGISYAVFCLKKFRIARASRVGPSARCCRESSNYRLNREVIKFDFFFSCSFPVSHLTPAPPFPQP